MALIRKSFVELAAELAAGLRAGRGDQPIAESARLGIVEIAPGDWRLLMVLRSSAMSRSPAASKPWKRSSTGWRVVRTRSVQNERNNQLQHVAEPLHGGGRVR